MSRIAATALQLTGVFWNEGLPEESGKHLLPEHLFARLRSWILDDHSRRDLPEYHRLRLALHGTARMRARYLTHMLGPKIDDIRPARPDERVGPWLRRWGRAWKGRR